MNNNIITHLLSYKTEDLGDKDMCLRQYMRIVIRKDAFSIKGGKRYIDPSNTCLLYTSPSPRDLSTSRMPSSA